VLLVIPVILYLVILPIRQNLMPLAYPLILGTLILPGLAKTIRAGNRLLPAFRAIQRFGVEANANGRE
jgi:hypothetical protein